MIRSTAGAAGPLGGAPCFDHRGKHSKGDRPCAHHDRVRNALDAGVALCKAEAFEHIQSRVDNLHTCLQILTLQDYANCAMCNCLCETSMGLK